MSVVERIPGTGDWLLASIDARVELRLRKELRSAQRDLDAVFAGLWVTTIRGDVLVEFAGELAVAPEGCPLVHTTIPTFETFVGVDGLHHDAVIHRPRLGRGMPRLSVLVADPAGMSSAELFDAVEASTERVEEILVAALTT
ncbi:MAG: hypothetical protein AB7S26_30640 [Sandaracinaceae bacterium]